MPDNRNRKRPIQVKFFVDESELGLIKARMAQLGIENMSAYLRKMAIDGYAAKPDLPECREPKKRPSGRFFAPQSAANEARFQRMKHTCGV